MDRVFVVYRIDEGSAPDHEVYGPLWLKLKSFWLEEENAILEVARLNTLNDDKGCMYFHQPVKSGRP